jgi:hypothetical protein
MRVCVFFYFIYFIFWFFVFAQGSFWPSGLGTRKKKRKLFVNINPSSCSHAYNEYWGGKGGGGGTDKVRPMSQLGNIHLCRYLVLIPILDTLVWWRKFWQQKFQPWILCFGISSRPTSPIYRHSLGAIFHLRIAS